jgi:hypothetical protein
MNELIIEMSSLGNTACKNSGDCAIKSRGVRILVQQLSNIQRRPSRPGFQIIII